MTLSYNYVPSREDSSHPREAKAHYQSKVQNSQRKYLTELVEIDTQKRMTDTQKRMMTEKVVSSQVAAKKKLC